MFIKLQYTADTRITVPLRTLKEIINNSAITSVSSLQSAWTGWDATLKANFDATNSNIIRTNSPTGTVAHFCINPSASYSYASYGESAFTLEQPTYDAASSKIYTQLSMNLTNVYMFFNLGNAITGGTISSASAAVTVSETAATTTGYGTALTVGGNALGSGSVLFSSGSGSTNVRTFWAYITDKCFFFATTNGTTYNSGWGTAYSDATKFCGPFFQTQYTRYDYHNLDSNGIVPVIYTNPRGAGVGYGTTNDLTTIQNILTNTATTAPIRAHSIVSALPQVGSAWPKIYNTFVNPTFAGRSTSTYAANQIQVIGTTTSSTLPSYAGGISTAASTRYPNATLTATGFGLMPFGWEANYYGNHGGNASEQCGVYIFNGDYVPGDTFTYNNKVYMIWPMTSGYSNRVGFAVPME